MKILQQLLLPLIFLGMLAGCQTAPKGNLPGYYNRAAAVIKTSKKSEQQMAYLNAHIKYKKHKAVAISKSGARGFSYGYSSAKYAGSIALAHCRRRNSSVSPCRLLVVDDSFVW
jgi:hypothetical protein